MSYPIVLLWLFGILFALYLLFLWRQKHRFDAREERLASLSFPEIYRIYLHRTVHYDLLDKNERERAERLILRFLDNCSFSGIGLDVSDEMRVIVAFYAVLVLLQRGDTEYPGLERVLLYREGFLVEEHFEQGGIVSSGTFELDGQSSPDTMVLSWEDAEEEACRLYPDNVIIHECAHLLDFETAVSGGDFADAYRRFAESESRELLGEYAAENEAEFFAVASERFFQCPSHLQRHFPTLFRLLREFYRVDPRRWGLEADPG